MSSTDFDAVKNAEQQYEDEVGKFLETHKELQPDYKTVSGIPLKRVYTPSDTEKIDYLKDVGFPGQYPYARGSYLDGYRTRAWKIQPLIGFDTCEETNQRWRNLISQGLTGLVLDGFPPLSCEGGERGQICYNSDDERTEGYIGHCCLVVETLADWERLFEGIDLEKINISVLSHQSVQFAMYLALAEERGVDKKKLRGTHETVTYGLSDGEEDRREQLDIMEYCVKNLPMWNITTFKGRNLRDGGCTAPQEIAINMAMGIDTSRALIEERGLDIDQFAPRMGFMFCANMDFLEEIAKLRAARRMWARIMKEKFVAKGRSQILRFHVQTAGSALTRQQPLNNIARAAVQGLAAILGGAQSLHLCPMDESYTIPTEFSTLLSMRVQQVLSYETGTSDTCDPLGGSYLIESLTNQLEEEAQEFLGEVEKRGGELRARQWIIEQISNSAYEYQRQIASKERIIVGVNEFTEGDYPYPFELRDYDASIAEKQIARLNKVRKERDNTKVEATKKRLIEAFKSKENITPYLIEASRAYLSAGEIHQCRVAAVGEEACYSTVCYEH